MNGYEFKREIERIFKVARNMYPNVTDEMLDTNGAIYYMNGNDSTPHRLIGIAITGYVNFSFSIKMRWALSRHS
jgi:hypothetical protein